MNLITIGNNGQLITSTNFWETEHAKGGVCYLSANAGALRLLVPKAAEGMLAEMQTGKRVIIEASAAPQCIDIVFDDGTDTPFVLSLDREMLDRKLTPSESLPFVIYTESGALALMQASVTTA